MSTYGELYDVLESVNTNLDNLENCTIVSLVLRRVFDVRNHDINKLNKLYSYDFRGIELILIKSYLPDRFQFIKYNNTNSNYNYIKCGLPH